MAVTSEWEIAESVQQFTSSWELIIHDLPGVDLIDSSGLAVRWADSPFTFWNAIFLSEPVADAGQLDFRMSCAVAYMQGKNHGGLIWICEEYLEGAVREKLPIILTRERLEPALAATGMAGEIFPLRAPAHPSLQIERVSNESMLRDYADINCEAYGLPVEWGRSALVPELWIREGYSYLGYENGRAVSTASVLLNEGCLFLALVATRPDAQKKGYGEAVVRHALQRAHEATGLTRTILHATDLGRPLYRRLGYHDTSTIMAYKQSE